MPEITNVAYASDEDMMKRIFLPNAGKWLSRHDCAAFGSFKKDREFAHRLDELAVAGFVSRCCVVQQDNEVYYYRVAEDVAALWKI